MKQFINHVMGMKDAVRLMLFCLVINNKAVASSSWVVPKGFVGKVKAVYSLSDPGRKRAIATSTFTITVSP